MGQARVNQDSVMETAVPPGEGCNEAISEIVGFRNSRIVTKLGTASRLYGWTGLALCDSSPHN